MIEMARNPKQIEFSKDELIVSKTDLSGKITYANRTFMKVCNFAEWELTGQNHNMIRHPDMPRGVFYGLWHTLKSGNEFFGFIKNFTSDGHYYWVFANVTPDLIANRPVGYYSVRRYAPKSCISVIEAIYSQMKSMEKTHPKETAPKASWTWLLNEVRQHHQQDYEHFMLDLYNQHITDPK